MSIQCMSWVLKHSTTSGTDRLVLLSLANHANEHGQSWPSVRTIAKEANVTERAVQRSLASMRRQGLITVEFQGAPDKRIPDRYRPNLYRVVRGDADDTPGEIRGDAGGQSGVTPVTFRGDASDTQSISEPNTDPSAAAPLASQGRPDTRLADDTVELGKTQARRLRSALHPDLTDALEEAS